jgi:hypothetical protein
LSVADQAFLEFAPIATMRVAKGVRTKSGRLAEARLSNAVLSQVDEANVHMRVHNSKSLTPIPGGVHAEFVGRNMTPKYTATVTRFLFKAALEFGYLDFGRDVVLGRKYRHVRRIALGGSYQGYLALVRNATPHDRVTFTHWPLQVNGEDAIWSQIDAFGVVMGTELLQRRVPKKPNPDLVAVMPF